MEKPFQVARDVEVLSTYFPVPGAGVLPINAFVIKAKEPVLVDTGIGVESDAFMEALESVIDPKDLRWVWLTHDDADHTGSLRRVMSAAPQARLVANALAVLRTTTSWPVPMDRAHWLNPGDHINVGDRQLTAVRPPLFDNPTTLGIYDNRTESLFSSDCFGAILPGPAQTANDIDDMALAGGMTAWASADSPWVHMVPASVIRQSTDSLRRLAPSTVFSSHLPPAEGMTERFLTLLETAPSSTPFVTPNQEALEAMLAEMKKA